AKADDLLNPLTVTTVEAPSGTATTELIGTTIKDATLVAVGFNNAAAPFTQVVNLGGVRKNFQSGDVTLTFKNIASVPTGSLHYKWGSQTAADTADAEFTIVSEAATGCVGKTSLAAGATCTVTVHFSPSLTSTAGSRTNNFVLSATPGNVVQLFNFQAYALEASGDGYIAISGGVNAFYTFPGTTPAGGGTTAPSQIFQVTNTTAANKAVAMAITTLSGTTDFVADYTAGSAPCASLAGGQLGPSSSCTFSIAFKPAPYTATSVYRLAYLSMPSIDGVWLGLMGRVQAPAELVLSPKGTGAYDFDFGQVGIGQTASRDFTVTNMGETTSAALTLTLSATVANIYSQTSTCTTLAAGASCTGTVTVTPGTATGDLGTGALSAYDVNTTSDNALSMHGYGVLPTTLGLTPSAPQTFPDTAVGVQSSTVLTVAVSNMTLAQTSGLLTVTLGDTTNFTLVGTGCPLASDTTQKNGGLGNVPIHWTGGLMCPVYVGFKPQAVGNLSTKLTVTASPGSAQNLTISGKGTSAMIITSSLGSGPIVVDGNNSSIASPFVLEVEMATSAPQTAFIKTTLAGTGYEIVYDSCVATKLSGSMPGPFACEIGVAFTGTAATPLKTATLTVNGGSAGQSASIVLNSTTPPS
ncbi:MAG TPA: choice-of-anchor D domain-containing protein, partial [Mycobacterium sp.]|nr:choice-of-anchor D domain-containing protein [Mycobacterium sp.]